MVWCEFVWFGFGLYCRFVKFCVYCGFEFLFCCVLIALRFGWVDLLDVAVFSDV